MAIARFPVRWRGYDRAAVDRFLTQFASDYDRLQANLASVEQLIATYREQDATGTLATARAEAEDIRRAAEQERARIIRQAEDHATQLVHERLTATRCEGERLAAVRQDAVALVESAVALLRRAEESLPAPPPRNEPNAAPNPVARADVRSALRRAARTWRSKRAAGALIATLTVVTIPAALYPTYRPARRLLVPPARVGMPEALTSPPPRSDTANGDGLIGVANAPALVHTSGAGNAGKAASEEPPARVGLTIVLRANSPCWIRVTLDGERVAEHLLQGGAEITLHAEHEALLRVGNAGALSVFVNGRSIRPLGRPGEVITRRINATSGAPTRES
jgi:DivIVA domain-containing protein